MIILDIITYLTAIQVCSSILRKTFAIGSRHVLSRHCTSVISLGRYLLKNLSGYSQTLKNLIKCHKFVASMYEGVVQWGTTVCEFPHPFFPWRTTLSATDNSWHTFWAYFSFLFSPLDWFKHGGRTNVILIYVCNIV